MSAEYSGDPATSDKDAVRFYIGDTDTSAPQFQDEEIDFLITSEGSAPRGAIRALLQLATRFSSKVDKAVGDLRISYSQQAAQYGAMARELRRRTSAPIPFIAGISVQEKIDVESDVDRAPNSFRIGQDDYPGTRQQHDDPRWYSGGVW